MKKMGKALVVCAFMASAFTNLAVAENQQDYVLNQAEMQRYIDLSRQEVEKSNLPLARVYAQKAVQANAWHKLAWANYDDVIQRVANEGGITDFGTLLEDSKGGDAPKPSAKGGQFEGC